MPLTETSRHNPSDVVPRHDWNSQDRQGLTQGLILALAVHAALIAALTWGVGWRQHRHTPTVAAELWAAVAMQEAPAPAPAPEPLTPEPDPENKPIDKPIDKSPPPAPSTPPAQTLAKPDINVEKAKKPPEKQPEKDKPESKPKDKKKVEQDKKRAAEQTKKEEAQLAAVRLQIEKEKARADAMARMNAMAKNADKPAGRDTQTAAPSQGYLGRISALIKPNITYTGAKGVDVEAQFEVVLSAQGVIQTVTLKKTSGIAAWDDAAYRALIKTERLPLDNGKVYSPLLFAMRPKDF